MPIWNGCATKCNARSDAAKQSISEGAGGSEARRRTLPTARMTIFAKVRGRPMGIAALVGAVVGMLADASFLTTSAPAYGHCPKLLLRCCAMSSRISNSRSWIWSGRSASSRRSSLRSPSSPSARYLCCFRLPRRRGLYLGYPVSGGCHRLDGRGFLVIAAAAAVYLSRLTRARSPMFAEVRREWQEDRVIVERILSADEEA